MLGPLHALSDLNSKTIYEVNTVISIFQVMKMRHTKINSRTRIWNHVVRLQTHNFNYKCYNAYLIE